MFNVTAILICCLLGMFICLFEPSRSLGVETVVPPGHIGVCGVSLCVWILDWNIDAGIMVLLIYTHCNKHNCNVLTYSVFLHLLKVYKLPIKQSISVY